MRTSRRLAAPLAVVLVVVACGAGPDPSSGEDTTTVDEATTPTTTQDEVPTTMQQPDLDQAALIEAATADLASRLRVDVESIALVEFKDVTWPDGSLGCPEPGMSYTQALVEGYQILLRHGDSLFTYHGADGDQPFLCPSDEEDGGYEFVPPPGFDE